MSKDLKTFINGYSFMKSLDLSEGATISLYNNKYRVIASRDDGMTLLKDIKDNPVAFSTERLKKMLYKSALEKAIPEAGAKPVSTKMPTSQMPKNVTTDQGHSVNDPKSTTARTQGSAGVKQKRQLGEMQNGKIYVLRHGKRYWVDAQTGSTHDSHDSSDAHHPVNHPDDHKMIADTRNKIIETAHPDDHEQLQKKFMNYVQASAAFSHVRHAVDFQSKQSGQNQSTATIDRVQAMGDKKGEAARAFKTAYTASVKKQMKAGE